MTTTHDIPSDVLLRGDLATLSDDEKTSYYHTVCSSMGLNPSTKPLEYIRLNGRLTLYATRNATDQLRKIHGVSIAAMKHQELGGCIVVTVSGRDGKGREDVSTGCVDVSSLRGDARANALMKCETKAKRRLTLSLCGLGFMDESEVETVAAATKVHGPTLDQFTSGPQEEKSTQGSSGSAGKQIVDPSIAARLYERLSDAEDGGYITADHSSKVRDAYQKRPDIEKNEYAHTALERLFKRTREIDKKVEQ